MNRLKREAICELCEEATGRKYLWQTWWKNGVLENGKTKWFTLEEIVTFLSELKERKNERLRSKDSNQKEADTNIAGPADDTRNETR